MFLFTPFPQHVFVSQLHQKIQKKEKEKEL
jgi:hypothetical protein